jgi:hypothetical protein
MKNLRVYGDPSAEFSLMGDQSAVTVVHDGSSYPSEVRLVTRLGGGLSAFGASLLTYLGAIPPGGEESAIVELEVVQPVSSAHDWARMKGLSGKFRLLFDQSAPVAVNALFGQELASALFPVTPYQEDMRYELRVRVVDRNKLAAGAEGHVIVGGGFKVKMDLEKGRMVVLERGVIRGGQLYPLELTDGYCGHSIKHNHNSGIAVYVVRPGDTTNSTGVESVRTNRAEHGRDYCRSRAGDLERGAGGLE